jgi:type III restriction enzyme
MNQITQYIKQRLSLRTPLQDSLDIVAKLVEELTLKKEVDLATELAKVRTHYPICTDFERAFPSLTFSIATGVGKTRLMGAMVAYLYLSKGIRNFFILAPGSTIYEKLIEDFGNPAFHKYVFNGIAEFVHNQPIVITGENYAQQGNLFNESEIRINIFNIQKFNRDSTPATRGKEKGKAPKIKRLSEYLGQSYWDYLSGLDDLVILMDEAHRYHGKASKKAINELKPILGLEMTATPIDQDGNVFKNVVYEYSLAQALADGKYVKSPAIATRKNFSKQGLSEREIEIIKLEDAISIHQDTRNELEIYAANNQVKLVKPFILVVCRETTHAGEIYSLINSNLFFGGAYKNKVLQIDSSTKSYDEEIERQFLTLEQPDNEIEIVIHVNMLKEGWDVTNLYTIVPLRAANAAVLIEQTIGRGLRLPYSGKRTGDDKIDKLTVVAHDNFDKVIQEANDPNSILNKMNFVEIEEDDLKKKTKVVTSRPTIQTKFEEEQKKIEKINEPQKKQEAQNSLDAKKEIINVWSDHINLKGVEKIDDLKKPKIRQKVIQKVQENLNKGQQNLFKEQILAEAESVYDAMVTEYKKNIIEIPRMDLVQGEVTATFTKFDLDTTNINYTVLEQEIIRMDLKDGKNVETIKAKSSGPYGNPIKLIIAELINYPEIDYDSNADLLYHLSTQAFESLSANIPDDKELNLTIYQFKAAIADKIYTQMKSHFELSRPDYIAPKVFPFVRIEDWNFSALVSKGYKDYADIVSPTKDIPKYVFRGFEKACHFEYKFDSKAEQDLAFVLENDKDVEKWLRPAPNQFRIYWDNNSKKYEPDFIVETLNTIYMIEVKRSDQIKDVTVLAKKEAAMRYCKDATDYTKINGGKEWKYLTVPHNEVSRTSSVLFIVSKFSDA